LSNPFFGFGGFDLGSVREIRIRSYTVGPGGSAQLASVELELWHFGAEEPQLVEVDYGDDGPALRTLQRLVATLNRRLRERPDAGA
jgi:hypothetical protein